MTSSASSRVSSGRTPGNRRASIVFPVPGGPISRRLCDPAAAISSARRARSWPRTSARSGTGASSRLPMCGSKTGASISPRRYETTSARCWTGTGSTPASAASAADSAAADEALEPSPASSLSDSERAGDGPDAAVERELAHRGVLCEPLRRKLPRRTEHRERDGEIEARPFLPEGRRRQIDGDAAAGRPLERSRDDAAPDPMLRLLARAIGEPDDGEARDARLQVRLDLDLARLEPDESMGDRTSEHPRHGRYRGVAASNAPVSTS